MSNQKAQDKKKADAHKAEDKHTADVHKADDKLKVGLVFVLASWRAYIVASAGDQTQG